MASGELFKGTLKTIVLQLLDEQGKMYGYQIVQMVKEKSEERMVLTEGALYPTLHKLESKGLLLTEKVQVGRRVRKYYRLSAKGRRELKVQLDEFQSFFHLMQKVLGVEF